MTHEAHRDTPPKQERERDQPPREETVRRLGNAGTDLSGIEVMGRMPENLRGGADVVALATIVKKYQQLLPVQRALAEHREHPKDDYYDDTFLALHKRAGAFKKLPESELEKLFATINDGLELYSRLPKTDAETPQFDKLDPGQEELLIQTTAAQQVIFATHQLLVARIAAKYFSSVTNEQRADLIQEGMIGLSTAIARFNPAESSAPFLNFASNGIDMQIKDYIAKTSRTIRIPDNVHAQYIQARRETAQLTQYLGRTPTDEEAARATGLSIENYRELMRVGATHLLSLDADILYEGVAGWNGVASTDLNDTESPAGNKSELLIRLLQEAGLSSRDQLIMALKYGLDDPYFDTLVVTTKQGETLTYEDIKTRAHQAIKSKIDSEKIHHSSLTVGYTLIELGKAFGCTGENIRLIERKVILRLREVAINRGVLST